MALFVQFGLFPAFPMIVDLIGYHGLSAFIHVNVAHDLLARLVRPHKRLQHRTAVALGFERQTPVSLCRVA